MKKALLIIGTLCLITVLSISTEKENNLLAMVDSGEKIIICHVPPGNPDNAHTIEVSVNALDAHLAHGDSTGACNDENEDFDNNPFGGQQTENSKIEL